MFSCNISRIYFRERLSFSIYLVHFEPELCSSFLLSHQRWLESLRKGEHLAVKTPNLCTVYASLSLPDMCEWRQGVNEGPQLLF